MFIQMNKFVMMIFSEKLTFDEKIKIIESSPNDAQSILAVWQTLMQFEDIVDEEDPIAYAKIVANAYYKCFGPIVVERFESLCNNEFRTIMDVFDDKYTNDYYYTFWNKMFRYAFKQAGFLYARDIHPKALNRLMYLKDRCEMFCDGVLPKELYEPSPFTEDLARYLYHPDRVSKWMKANPDKELEEYLN